MTLVIMYGLVAFWGIQCAEVLMGEKSLIHLIPFIHIFQTIYHYVDQKKSNYRQEKSL